MADSHPIAGQSVPWPPGGDVPRYCDRELPAFAYLPGVNQRPKDFEVSSENAFVYGVDLYNHAYWWEAHDAWEAEWHRQPQQSLSRLGLGLLINAANLNLKITLGNAKAADRLWRDMAARHEEWRVRGGARLFGVDIESWFVRYRNYVTRIIADPDSMHDRRVFPVLHIAASPD